MIHPSRRARRAAAEPRRRREAENQREQENRKKREARESMYNEIRASAHHVQNTTGNEVEVAVLLSEALQCSATLS